MYILSGTDEGRRHGTLGEFQASAVISPAIGLLVNLKHIDLAGAALGAYAGSQFVPQARAFGALFGAGLGFWLVTVLKEMEAGNAPPSTPPPTVASSFLRDLTSSL